MRSNCASDAVIPEVVTLGVGQVGEEEEAFAELRGSHGGSRYSEPFRIEPEVGKITEDVSKSSINDAWDIFKIDEAGSYLANNSGELGPEPPFVLFAFPFTGDADGLARRSAGHD